MLGFQQCLFYKPGPVGNHRRLDKLDDGNLKHHTDFRAIYATVLDQWLGVKSVEVLNEKFAGVKIDKKSGLPLRP